MSREELITKALEAQRELRSMHPVDPFMVSLIVDSIIECLAQLINGTPADSPDAGKYESTLQMLVHTRRKEVNNLRDYYDKMKKPRAAAVRQTEFDNYYRELVDRIDREMVDLSLP